MIPKHYNQLRQDYVKRLKESSVDTSDPSVSLISAWMCVCTVLVLPQPETTLITMVDAYEVSTKFTVMYIYVDSYLDDPETSPSDKVQFMQWMLCPSDDESRIKSTLMSIRRELELRYEDVCKWMEELTHNTIASTKIQYASTEGCNPRVTSDKLKKVCLDKGGITLLTLYRLIYGPNTGEDESVFEVGECLQLIDDIIDCSHDISEGINTYCTFTLQCDTNMDTCARLLLSKLRRIDEKYNLIVMGVRLALRYTVLKSHNFTIKLRTQLGLPSYSLKSKSFLTGAEAEFKRLQI